MLEGLRARGPVHRRARAVHDRHGHPRRRGASRHHAARAHGRRVLVGPPLPHLERAGDRAAGGGQAQHGDVPAARRAPGPGRSGLPRERRRADRLDARRLARRGGSRGRAARARLASRSTWARAAPRTPRAGSAPPAVGPPLHARYEPPARGGRRGAGGALPAGAGHAEDAPLPQLHVREPGPPALGAARADGVRAPRRRRATAASPTARACACTTTAATSPARRGCPTTPARACWWRRWAGGTATTRAAAAARPPRRSGSPSRATRRSSTTTAWSGRAPL